MATKQYGAERNYRFEQVTEATGGSAPTVDVEVNIKTTVKPQEAIQALKQIIQKIGVSKVFP